MKYRHSFHAGNFADVHKHVALLALLRAMQRKDKGFLYLDTHAGAGRYDLAAPESHRGAEARHGITALMSATADPAAEEIKDYRDTIAALRTEFGDAHVYPGSPWLAAHTLRAQDRGICWEILPAECRALERALGGYRRMRAECADGYQQLSAVLPSRERRCLLLIDPPYENPSAELDQALQIIVTSLQRLANAVVLMWYPIKDERTLAPWLARVERALSAPTLSLELWIYPRDSRVGLNGSGLLLVNPPYQFEQRAALWQQELHGLLDKAQHGGSSLQWLLRDSDLDHASA
jgi:23S rRNA (adenine2030-N6)-methyltransferase